MGSLSAFEMAGPHLGRALGLEGRVQTGVHGANCTDCDEEPRGRS